MIYIIAMIIIRIIIIAIIILSINQREEEFKLPHVLTNLHPPPFKLLKPGKKTEHDLSCFPYQKPNSFGFIFIPSDTCSTRK